MDVKDKVLIKILLELLLDGDLKEKYQNKALKMVAYL